MVAINASTKPKFVRPELLLHPSIPPALSGVNPRTIKGREWWDLIRKKAYAGNNYCCWACGVYQLDTPLGKLDAHECYEYDTEKFEARMTEVVALCRECHHFIHWRRIYFKPYCKPILQHGLEILHAAGLQLPGGQLKHLWLIGGGHEFVGAEILEGMPFSVMLSRKWKLKEVR